MRARIYEFTLFPTHHLPITYTELSRQAYPPENVQARKNPKLVRSTGYYDCYVWKPDRSDPTLLRPLLLAVNKQMRAEASEIFYSQAVFRVPYHLI